MGLPHMPMNQLGQWIGSPIAVPWSRLGVSIRMRGHRL